MYQRVAVYDSHNLNTASFNKSNRINSGGMAAQLAGEVVNQIQNLKGKYKAVIHQYDTWAEVPESFVQDAPATP